MRFAPRCWPLLISTGAVLGSASCVSRHVPNSAQTGPGNIVFGTPWKTWRGTNPNFAPAMLASLDAVVAQNSPEAIGVLRSRGPAAHSSQSCFPFEESHTKGHALDLAVGDWNRDGKSDLLDACVLASSMEAHDWQGVLGVYGHQTVQGRTIWVHADADGKGRWGGLRDDKTKSAQPLVWSAKALSLPALCRQRGIAARDLRVVIEKQPLLWRFERPSQTMNLHPAVMVYAGQRLVKAYPAALGFDPVGDKQQRDDYRTPEGEFYLCEHKANSRFYRALRLSYPNAEDAARGLRQGLIDKNTCDRIRRAIRRKRVPPQNTRLGGDIMIHGGGVGHNWTWGCVALENKDIQELFDFLQPGTRVTIKGAAPGH